MSNSKLLEVGAVYKHKKSGTYFLAVDHRLLVTYARGRIRELRPSSRRGLERGNISIDEICTSWGVDASIVDHITQTYIRPEGRPPASGRRPHLRPEAKADAATELEEWIQIRKHRLYGH